MRASSDQQSAFIQSTNALE
jgi:hypothetical protein